MGKLTFKNKIFNLVTAGFFILAAIIGLIGLLGVDAIDYLSTGIYYILGIGAMVFAGINMFASFKKANKTEGNITIAAANLIGAALGLILFIHIMKVNNDTATYTNEEFWFNPARVFGLILYLEGVQLILVSKFNIQTSVKRTLLGIFFITFGAISFIWLKSEHIAYSLDAILFLFGFYYLFVGLKPIIDKKRGVQSNTPVEVRSEDDNSEVIEIPEKKRKALFGKKKQEQIEIVEENQLENKEIKELPHNEEEEKDSLDDLFE